MTEVNLVDDIRRADTLEPFEAFDALWTALVRVANQRHEKNEHQRMLGLIGQLAPETLTSIARSAGMDSLVALDPPLETVQTNPHERLAPEHTARAFVLIRTRAAISPQTAIEAVGEILKRIRNKREHGFKSTDPKTRDGQILHAAVALLHQLCVEITNRASHE